MVKTKDIPQYLREFNSLFTAFGYRFDAYRLFDDFLSIAICALAHQTEEERYFELIKPYNKKELDLFVKLFVELSKIYHFEKISKGWVDPLGTYYEVLSQGSKKSKFGQFFTPESLCEISAQLIIPPDQWGKNILEPSSGSGRMVLAANKHAPGNFYTCIDLDPICCKMTALNLCFHEIRARVYCKNALNDEKPYFSLVINHDFWRHGTKSILYIK